MEFSQDIKDLIKEHFNSVDIYSLTLNELKKLREDVVQLRQEYFQLEMAFKTLGNAAYGSSASFRFYFYNVALAGDITGECRNLTKTMNANLEDWFHEGIWVRKDLWEKYDFALDESKHDWYRKQAVWIYSDTDSSYVTFGDFFKAMTPEYQEKYASPKAKLDWILKYNLGYQNDLNTQWCKDIYEPRHGKNVHEFELETVSYAGIYLKKKKYLKGLAYSKGKFFDKPKVSGTGIEIIKSTTPKLARSILSELMRSLMFDFKEDDKEAYIMEFNEKLDMFKKQFYNAPIEDISQSVSIGAYKKYVIDDEDNLLFEKQCPVSVQAIARFNHLAYKNGENNLKTYSGKIKYYNIKIDPFNPRSQSGYFGFPAGTIPEWSPKIDIKTQWEKNIIDPINRFLEVMNIPLVNASGTIQYSLFGENMFEQ